MTGRWGTPALWLPLGLLALTVAGGWLLQQPGVVELTERQRTATGLRPQWQAHFDALSASAGVGLLTYDLEREYTPRGRWTLAALGFCGGLLYVVAWWRVLALRGRVPSLGRVLMLLMVLQLLAALACGVWVQLDGEGAFLDGLWEGVVTFASLGFGTMPAIPAWLVGAVALLSALGWVTWLPWSNGMLPARRWVLLVGSYVALLTCAAVVIAALESPRGPRGGSEPVATLSGALPAERLGRSVALVATTAGAGRATEPIAERGVTEGTKLVLAGVVLVGGVGGTTGGGVTWLLLACAGGGVLGGREERTLPRPALGIVAGFGLLTVATSIALLLIETHTASAYQRAPTLGDALLESASAVGGAGLTTGLTATVTSANLVRGIRQGVDSYACGMIAIMFAMFMGRVLPIVVLGWVRCAPDRSATGPAPGQCSTDGSEHASCCDHPGPGGLEAPAGQMPPKAGGASADRAHGGPGD